MIVRDEQGCIMQHDIFNANNRPDGGDSASRVGIMALCGSKEDQKILPLFAPLFGDAVRHPTQEPWNNPKNFTRDQLTCLAAGLFKTGFLSHARNLHDGAKARGWRAQNTEKDFPGTVKKWPDGADWLAPDIRLHLKLCAGIDASKYFIGYMFLWLSLVYNCFVNPKHEQNQFICQLVVAGPKWVKRYKRWNKTWKVNVIDYWCGWRDQAEIAMAMIDLLEKEEYKV